MIKRLHSTLMFSHDLAATASFYEKCGFLVQKAEDSVRIIYGDFRLCWMDESKTVIKVNVKGETKGVGVFTYVEVDNVDDHYEVCKQNGLEGMTEPKDWPWGRREFVVKDPDGYRTVFFASVKK